LLALFVIKHKWLTVLCCTNGVFNFIVLYCMIYFFYCL
jgi:hypothetical protein